ncbi:MAG: hypothetical protein Q8L55_04245, partial [Phycisphaerales bacterium]|nr:hypothetical protein [Phycisphaerales bacterium]
MSALTVGRAAGMAVCVYALLGAASVLAQSLYTPGTLTAWGPTAGSALTTNTLEGNHVAGAAVFARNYVAGGGATLYRWTGTPQENGDANPDRFTYGWRTQTQQFGINANADIVVPVLWDGRLVFSGHGAGANL